MFYFSVTYYASKEFNCFRQTIEKKLMQPEIYIVRIIDLNTKIYYTFSEKKIYNKILLKNKHSIDPLM